MKSPPAIIPGRYRRYDGEMFLVHCVAQHTEANYRLVIYHQESKPDLPEEWQASPDAVFRETVSVNGGQVQRFQRVEMKGPECAASCESEKTG